MFSQQKHEVGEEEIFLPKRHLSQQRSGHDDVVWIMGKQSIGYGISCMGYGRLLIVWTMSWKKLVDRNICVHVYILVECGAFKCRRCTLTIVPKIQEYVVFHAWIFIPLFFLWHGVNPFSDICAKSEDLVCPMPRAIDFSVRCTLIGQRSFLAFIQITSAVFHWLSLHVFVSVL